MLPLLNILHVLYRFKTGDAEGDKRDERKNIVQDLL